MSTDKCKGNLVTGISRIVEETKPIRMYGDNFSITNNRTTNNQQVTLGAPSNQVLQQQQSSQYSNGNENSNQNNLNNNNFNMVAADQQNGMDMSYNSQVLVSL